MSRKLILLLVFVLLALPLAAQDEDISPQNAGVTLGTDGLPWWNDRVFYEVFVRSFYDSDGDGRGDLQGLIAKLDYLNDGDPTTDSDLGVTGLWLMPIMQSPSYHGYDVTDYYTVNPDYGTNEDFLQLVEAAHERGMVVIVDLVLNHTSTNHPWFRESRAGGTDFDDWYIWEDESPGYPGPWGQQVWHRAGDRLYYGVFWEGMPDLNYNNPDVMQAMLDVTRFWLEDMNADGFRLDAIKHMVEDGRVQENTPATHAVMQQFHSFVREVSPDAFLVGEAWTDTEEVIDYIGDEVDAAFEFDLAETIIQSANFGSTAFVAEQQAIVNEVYPRSQYAAFLTNHDQNRAMSAFNGDVNKAKVAATVLLTNPGIPFIYYGEEIGMVGQKPDERIRTPMQWDTTGGNGGFSTGRPWQSLQDDHPRVNVATQADDPDSLLSHYRRLIHLRNESDALRAGEMTLVQASNRGVYTYLRHTDEDVVLVIINMGRRDVENLTLTLEAGPLAAGMGAELLFGEGEITPPQINAEGGFIDYAPIDGTIPAFSSYIVQLR